MMIEIITRQQALKDNLRFYFNGIPCPKGHVSERKVLNSECSECSREYMREYSKAYREKNKQKQNIYSRDYRTRYGREAGVDKKGRMKEHIKNLHRRSLNKKNDRRRVAGNAYGLMCVYNQRYHYAMPKWADVQKMKAIYNKAKRLREETAEDWQVDHIIPVRGENVCGLHVETNLRIIRGKENMSKKNKLLDEFAYS